MARIKAPTSRKKTRGDQRTLRIESSSLPLVVGVAVIAAIISFVALKWVGDYMGMVIDAPWGTRMSYAPLLPIAIDGFGIICALGIVRSRSVGEPVAKRASEWAGLFISLGLSIAGNIVHTMHFVNGTVPPIWLIVAYSAAVPAIVAYGLHLLGRIAHDSLSSRIYVDDPDHVQLDVPGVPNPMSAAPGRAAEPAPARTAPAAAAVSEARSTAPRRTAPPGGEPIIDRRTLRDAKDRYFEIVRDVVARGGEVRAADVRRQVEGEGYEVPTEGAGRKWVTAIVAELDAVAPPTDRGAADLDAARSIPERASA